MHLRMGSYVYIYRIFAICEWNTYDIWYIEKNRRHAPTASASSCWAESSSPGKKKNWSYLVLRIFLMLQRREVDFFSTWRLCYGEATGSCGSSKKVSLAFRFLKQGRKTTCSCAAKSLQQNFVPTRTFKTYAFSLKWLCRYAFFKSIIEKDSVRLVKFILQIEQLPELVCLAKALCSSPLHFLSFFGRWCKQEVSENLSGLVQSCKHAIQNSSEFIRTAFLAGYQVYQNESLGCQVPCLATAWWGCLLAVTGWRPQLSKSSELVLHQE